MARTFTIAELKTRCRRRANMENSNFISDAELLDLINESYAFYYDTLVSSFQNYFILDAEITLVSGTAQYDLPDDFYKVVGVDLAQGGDVYETLFPFNELERNSTLSVASSVPNGTVRLRYIPAPTIFTLDAETVDGVSGWEALIVSDVAVMMLDKEESDSSSVARRRDRELQRIQSMAQNRDVTNPGTITDVTVYDDAYIKDALRYRFYGNKLEFINASYIGV